MCILFFNKALSFYFRSEKFNCCKLIAIFFEGEKQATVEEANAKTLLIFFLINHNRIVFRILFLKQMQLPKCSAYKDHYNNSPIVFVLERIRRTFLGVQCMLSAKQRCVCNVGMHCCIHACCIHACCMHACCIHACCMHIHYAMYIQLYQMKVDI